MDQAVAELLEAVGDAVAIAGDDDVIEALGIEAMEPDLVGEIEPAQHLVDGLAFAAAEDVVDLSAEAIRADAEGVGVAARGVVGLAHQDPAPVGGQERGHGQPRHPGADHQLVEGGRGGIDARRDGGRDGRDGTGRGGHRGDCTLAVGQAPPMGRSRPRVRPDGPVARRIATGCRAAVPLSLWS
jgi:hypothetical protein